jgi:hypothetical protein
MEPKLPEEKIKPFRLVKYFAFTGLIVIFLVTIMLSVFNTYWVKSMQRKKSEDYAHVMIENLNHQVFLQFIIPVGLMFGKIQLSKREQFERMDNVVRSTMHSFKVETVNIYSMDNEISYSYDQSAAKTSAEPHTCRPGMANGTQRWFNGEICCRFCWAFQKKFA